MRWKRIITIALTAVCILCVPARTAQAQELDPVVYKVTDAATHDASDASSAGGVYFYRFIQIPYQYGKVILSSTPDGTGSLRVDDSLQISTSSSNSLVRKTACSETGKLLPPQDITHLFKSGTNISYLIRFSKWCANNNKTTSDVYITYKPSPVPFLDLPWDYQGSGMTFSEAATSMFSFFDHEYPLSSSNFSEPPDTNTGTVRYNSVDRTDTPYSSHDGYDYAVHAKVKLNDPVLSAAAGWATYSYCQSCGHQIIIDHTNGYQTRYLHLQPHGLIVDQPGTRVWIDPKRQIGRVGMTGNTDAPHIHFAVYQDKNGDGTFEDNVPDGATDPYGWQPLEQDPWAAFSFLHNGLQRSGNKSSYLWKYPLGSTHKTVTNQGATVLAPKTRAEFPQGITAEPIDVSIVASPIKDVSANLTPLASSKTITAHNQFGDMITGFSRPFNLIMDFAGMDLTRIDPETVSIYSSQDGVNWIKEHSQVDLQLKKASAPIDHLTHFAVMAEKLDAVNPTTTARIEGEPAGEGAFSSPVTITLTAEDNEGGSGIEYIQFKKNSDDWTLYDSPITIEEQGHHTIQYRAVDADANEEAIHTLEFGVVSPTPAPPEGL